MASKKIAGITIELSTDTAKLTKSLDKVSKQFESVGKSFTKNVTAPILAIGVASIAAFKQVDEGMDIIVTKTGATGEALESMQETLKNIASEIPASFDDIGSAIGEVNTRFGLLGDELEDVSTQFLKFAQINGVDVSEAVDSAQKTLAAFGLGAEKAAEYLDILNRVGQNTGISVETLSSGLQQNALAFQEMGLSLEQAAVFMGQVEMSGADVSTVMSSLSRALKNATKNGKPLNEALAELEDSIKNGADGMDGLTLAYDLFGRSGATVYNALQQGTLSFKDLAEASLDAGGSVSDTFEATLDPIDRFQIAMQKLQILGAEIGARLMDVLLPLFEKFGEFITNLLDKWESLSPGMQEAIIKIGLIVAAIGPLLTMIGTIISTISSLIAINGALSGGLAALSGPIGIVVAAIAGLIAIGVALYKNWDTIKAKAIEVWEGIKAFFVEVWNGIKESAEAIWEGIKLYYITLFDFFKNYFTQIWDGIKKIVLGVWEGIKKQAEIIWNTIKMAVTDPIGALKYFLSSTWENIKSTASRVWEGIKKVITAPIDSAVNTIKGLIDKIKGFFPIKLSNIFSNFKIPHISAQWVEGFMGIKYPKFSVDWYAKAYQNAMRFTSPTVLSTPSGYKGFGDGNGAEWVIGENKLLSTIQQAMGNSVNPELLYEAVKQGASEATLNLYADGRLLTNVVNEQNTNMLASTRRTQGAF